ncbi:RRQRL motif-containing zinc-binding protein [Saccharopolyspora shandongensis]|uniref:RRQRL motif-containing zinc-binding protein n=1 Tax=Saccharopolyspora shandongensis TaxID=418495 RepID=UPI00342D8144
MSGRTLELVELPDGRREFGWIQDGLPTFPFRFAPKGLATRRQLRAAGLCPGGQGVVAQIVWRRGKAWAGLYRVDLARPKRIPSAGQRRALLAAMAARRRCVRCGRDAGYYLPRARTCWGCTNNDAAAQAA